jgi:hypothetical protein
MPDPNLIFAHFMGIIEQVDSGRQLQAIDPVGHP